jgi:hypothetical protein
MPKRRLGYFDIESELRGISEVQPLIKYRPKRRRDFVEFLRDFQGENSRFRHQTLSGDCTPATDGIVTSRTVKVAMNSGRDGRSKSG